MAVKATMTATPKGALKTGGALGLGRWSIGPRQQREVAQAAAAENNWAVKSVDTVADPTPGKPVTFTATFETDPNMAPNDAVNEAALGGGIVSTGTVVLFAVMGISAAVAWSMEDIARVSDNVEGVARSQFATLVGGAALAWAVSKVLDAWYKRAS